MFVSLVDGVVDVVVVIIIVFIIIIMYFEKKFINYLLFAQ